MSNGTTVALDSVPGINAKILELHSFADATTDLQSNVSGGRHGSIWKWLPTVKLFLKHTKEGFIKAQEKSGS